MASSQDHQIQTFVLFDTETTGLPSPGNNPRITEMCFLAVTKGELLTKQAYPRVLNKLVICCNPCKKIGMKSSEITGLHNDSLEMLETFRRQAALITLFLKNLPQPVCIIAHNGNRFDFPLLASELRDAGEVVLEGIFCADSLEALRTFDGLPAVPEFLAQRKKNNNESRETVTATEEQENSVNANQRVTKIHPVVSEENKVYNFGITTIMGKDQERSPPPNNVNPKSAFSDSFTLLSKESEFWNVSENTPQRPSSGVTENYTPDKSRVKRKSWFSDPEGRLKVRRNLDKNIDADGSSDERSNNVVQTLVTENSGVSRSISENTSIDISDATVPYSLSTYSSSESHPSSLSDSPNTSHINTTVTDVLGISTAAESELLTDSDTELLLGAEEVDAIILKDQGVNEYKSSSNVKVEIQPSNSRFSEEKNQIPGTSENCSDPNSNKYHSVMRIATEPLQSKSTLSNTKGKSGVYATVVEAHRETQVSYSLPKVYARAFGQMPEVSHTAEDDCVTLLKIMNLKSKEFVRWCDKNASPLASVHPMY